MSELEPRRSVRSTKGQHKSLDQLEQRNGPKKRGRRGGKKTEEKQEDPEEEIIRCVCGATEQDEDSGEPWIACDKCAAWQHNVCMGMSVYSEDLPKEYFCEICKPEDHEELLAAIANGEKLWEERRTAYEEEKANEKKKKGGKRGRGKRLSDTKDESPQASQKSKSSPTPDVKKEKEKEKETKAAVGTKRKSRGVSEDKDAKATTQKLRKVSETQAVPVPVPYNPPSDIPDKITELLDTRQKPAVGLFKSINHAIGVAEKKNGPVAADGVSNEARAERFALQIERAVHDAHPNHKEYSSQIRTLSFNLKTNAELCNRLLNGTLTPNMLAVMSSDELASKELQRETAEMKARAEKQSILVTEDGPRVRRTHKGEEMIENDSFTVAAEDKPSAIRRQSVREVSESKSHEREQPSGGAELPSQEIRHSPPKDALHIDTQQSPKTDFDINKVFSSVRSPVAAHQRRPSQAVPPPGGPGVDPEVDRLLQDDDREESPPYSPKEETDPSVIWRGHLTMSSIADFQVVARHVAGVNLSTTISLPWDLLIPKRLTVAGRIDQQKATEYLCGLRYSVPTDVIVTSLDPATEMAKPGFHALIDYFLSKKRFGVVGEQGVGNVRDTYLIPVPPGIGNHPEFMLNLEDNFLPTTRPEPMLLAVFVYRNDAAAMEKLRGPNWAGDQQRSAQSPVVGTTPTPTGHRQPSLTAPAFSPTSPQGAFSNYHAQRNSQTPSQQHMSQLSRGPEPGYQNAAAGGHQQHAAQSADIAEADAQRRGEEQARQILGPFISAPTVSFLLPQAHRMGPNEWALIKTIFEQDGRAREDLTHLSRLIEQHSSSQAPASTQAQAPAPIPKMSQTPVPIPHIPHSAAPAPRPVQGHPPPPAPTPQPAAAPPT